MSGESSSAPCALVPLLARSRVRKRAGLWTVRLRAPEMKLFDTEWWQKSFLVARFAMSLVAEDSRIRRAPAVVHKRQRSTEFNSIQARKA
jgi:hypothetical protein